MCRSTTCKTCGKTTWAGCGMHVDQVMAQVPTPDRCPGHPKNQPTTGTGTATGNGWLRTWLGR